MFPLRGQPLQDSRRERSRSPSTEQTLRDERRSPSPEPTYDARRGLGGWTASSYVPDYANQRRVPPQGRNGGWNQPIDNRKRDSPPYLRFPHSTATMVDYRDERNWNPQPANCPVRVSWTSLGERHEREEINRAQPDLNDPIQAYRLYTSVEDMMNVTSPPCVVELKKTYKSEKLARFDAFQWILQQHVNVGLEDNAELVRARDAAVDDSICRYETSMEDGLHFGKRFRVWVAPERLY
jgi:hypothetical protein